MSTYLVPLSVWQVIDALLSQVAARRSLTSTGTGWAQALRGKWNCGRAETSRAPQQVQNWLPLDTDLEVELSHSDLAGLTLALEEEIRRTTQTGRASGTAVRERNALYAALYWSQQPPTR